jgi:hypothetical protein
MTPWHVPHDLLDRFARQPGVVDPTVGASIEQHLIRCPACRAEVADALERADDDELDRIWHEIADTVDRRPRAWSARVLWAPLAERGWGRLVAATPTLLVQLLAAVAALTVGAAFAATRLATDTAFLLVAPLVVAALVVVAFPPWREPTGETGAATPLAGFRAWCVRGAVAISGSMLPLGFASLLLPGAGWSAFAWVLPALALTLVALVAATRWEPVTVVGVLAGLWSTPLVLHRLLAEGPVDAAWMGSAIVQLSALSCTVVAAVGLCAMRASFDAAPVTGRKGVRR